MITAHAEGTATVTVTSNDGGFTAQCAVTVSRILSADATLADLAVSDGTLTPSFNPGIFYYTVNVGNETAGITITATPNHPAASVSGEGTQSLNVGENDFSIIVYAENGDEAVYTITVVRDAPAPVFVTGVSLDITEMNLKIDSVMQLTASIFPANADNQNLTWSSSNTAVAAVSNSGRVTAIAEGTATITVTTEDGGFTAACTVMVEKNQTIVVDEGKPAGSNGTGTIVLSLEIPSNSPFSGTFRLKLPTGMSVDANATDLVEALKASMTMVVTQQGDGSWLFTITTTPLRSSMALSYQKIADIVYRIDESITDGAYQAVIYDLNLNFDDGTSITESEIPVSLTVDHSYTGIPPVSAEIKAYISGNILYVDSPASETVSLYSVSGALLYNTKKPAGEAQISLGGIQEKVLIVRGGTGWVRKGVRK